MRSDSVHVPVQEVKEVALPQFRPELDLTLTIPSGFWISGRNMEAELSGDLKAATGDDNLPSITGTLRANRGSITLLGRNFEVERGQVDFYGDYEPDPSLDLTMASNISSYTVRVLITGKSSDPRLKLTSEPDLPEGDIMSLILFGKPAGELNEGQMDMLGDRSRDVVAAYAAAELSQALSGQMGMDMVSVRSGSGSNQGSALVLGKYLNTKTLVKYEQGLSSEGGFLVNLEYSLNEIFKLISIYESSGRSSAGVTARKDY